MTLHIPDIRPEALRVLSDERLEQLAADAYRLIEQSTIRAAVANVVSVTLRDSLEHREISARARQARARAAGLRSKLAPIFHEIQRRESDSKQPTKKD